MDSHPGEILELIFEHVHERDGDAASASLISVCQSWQRIVADDVFCIRVHFKWLASTYDWEKASEDFKEQYFVMYEIEECFGCGSRVKVCLISAEKERNLSKVLFRRRFFASWLLLGLLCQDVYGDM